MIYDNRKSLTISQIEIVFRDLVRSFLFLRFQLLHEFLIVFVVVDGTAYRIVFTVAIFGNTLKRRVLDDGGVFLACNVLHSENMF